MGLVLSCMVGMCICVYMRLCIGWYGWALGKGTWLCTIAKYNVCTSITWRESKYMRLSKHNSTLGSDNLVKRCSHVLVLLSSAIIPNAEACIHGIVAIIIVQSPRSLQTRGRPAPSSPCRLSFHPTLLGLFPQLFYHSLPPSAQLTYCPYPRGIREGGGGLTASASGLTPFSIRLAHMLRVLRSR